MSETALRIAALETRAIVLAVAAWVLFWVGVAWLSAVWAMRRAAERTRFRGR